MKRMVRGRVRSKASDGAYSRRVTLFFELSVSFVLLSMSEASLTACSNRKPQEVSRKPHGTVSSAAPATVAVTSGAAQEQPMAAVSSTSAPVCKSDAGCSPPARCVAVALPSPHLVPLPPAYKHVCEIPCRESAECPKDQVCNCDAEHRSSEGIPCHYCFCERCEQAEMMEFQRSLERMQRLKGAAPSTLGSKSVGE